MFNAIIIDNEPFIIKSLLTSIPWDNLNVTVIMTFDDSNLVLDYLEHNKVDFVITDIRMPGLSGLDLCHHIFYNFPRIKTIIISGYADFTYAQKSIKYKVLGYCVKPLDYHEITLLLQSATKNIDTSRIPSYDIIDAIQDEENDFLESYLQNLGINPEAFYLLSTIGSCQLSTVSLLFHTTIKLGRNRFIYLSNHPYPLDMIQKLDLFHIDIQGLSVCNQPSTLLTFKQNIKTLMTMSYQFFMVGTPYVSTIAVEANSSTVIKSLRTALATENIATIKNSILSLYTTSISHNCNILFAIRLYNIIMTYYSQVNQLEMEDEYIFRAEDLCKKYDYYNHMLDHLMDLLSNKMAISQVITTYNNNFLHVLQYINENYQNSISISAISQKLNLNQN